MEAYIYEWLGTMILIILGNGVVSNVLLTDTKGHGSGWIVITLGWAMAVFVAVYMVAPKSGAHINPAVTIGFAIIGKFSWFKVLPYIASQVLGAMTGSLINYLVYKDHYLATSNQDIIQATHCTSPAIKNKINNLLTEAVATFVLLFGAMHIISPQSSLGSLDALPVSLLILGIGLSLGGPTGYAINPARDLGPRIIYHLIPSRNRKLPFDFEYFWIPIVGPIIGSTFAALAYLSLQ